MQGTVKWFDAKKGYGFIKPDGSNKDIFLHITEVQKAGLTGLKDNDKISFEMISDSRSNKQSAGNLDLARSFRIVIDQNGQKAIKSIATIQAEMLELEKIQLKNVVEGSSKLLFAEPVLRIIDRITQDQTLLKQLSPREFEEFCLELLNREGWEGRFLSAWNQKDGGIDIVAMRRLGGGLQTSIAVQCKHTSRRVDARPIREISSVRSRVGAHIGVVMTTSTFTKDALEEAQSHYFDVSLRDYQNLINSLTEEKLL